MAKKKNDKALRADKDTLYWYGDLLAESSHPIYKDEHGTLRWVPNTLCRWIADECKRLPEGGIFNIMAVAYDEGKFSLEEYKEFYRDIGYTLCGFSEIFPSGR